MKKSVVDRLRAVRNSDRIDKRGTAATLLVAVSVAAFALIGVASSGADSYSYYYCPGGGNYTYCPPVVDKGTLIVIKHVINDDGGLAVASDFTMSINGIGADGGSVFPGQEAPGTTKSVTTGNYTVTEIGPAGYTASFSAGCSGTIAKDETKTCTVTNDDQPATLTVIKHVINDNNGKATAASFTIQVTGANASPSSFPGSESGTAVTLDGNTQFSVGETGPGGYGLTKSGTCSGTLPLGGSATCTLTNNDFSPRLTIGFWKSHEAETTALLPQTLGPYSVATFAQASAIFAASNCGKSTTMDALACLAAQLLAAKLNLANNADTCIQPTVAKADTFLSGGTVTVGGVTAAGVVYTGPSGTYTLTPQQRAIAVALANVLDAYNNNAKKCTNA